jgi:hypothetical protein
MGEADGVHKRRVFRWSIQVTELAREYKERANGRQEHSESDRRRLVTKLAEVSGNPRDACLRFLREFGVNQKRAYREWTKPEQQRLMDLVASMPVEEPPKSFDDRQRPFAPCCTASAWAAKQDENGSPSFHCLAHCIPAPMRYRNGLIAGGSNQGLSPVLERKQALSIQTIFASS